MFSKRSQLKKKFEKAKELVRLSQKVYDYRRDVIDPQDLRELKDSIDSLSGIIKREDVSDNELKKAYDRLHIIAKKCGGKIYPVSFWAENTEMIVVAAVLALGIRTFFLQPFSIPTNSMYPSFYGMTTKVYTTQVEKPNFVKRVFRAIVLGATNHELKAPDTGELIIPLFPSNGPLPGHIRFEKARSFRFFILPTPARLYTLYVDDKEVKVKLPWDFSDIEDIVTKTYYPEFTSFRQVIEQSIAEKKIVLLDGIPVIRTGKTVKKSQAVLDFDVLTGDTLFVNRMVYHFRMPKIGEPIVFPTINIEGMRAPDGTPEDKYFIKRLVGLGGDKLEVKESVLYRNGKPIEGAPAFDFNANKVGDYPGYKAEAALAEGRKVEIPEGYFYAMGDNSPHSMDSRSWGAVPEKEIIGRAFFIFYPFTKRWGMAN